MVPLDFRWDVEVIPGSFAFGYDIHDTLEAYGGTLVHKTRGVSAWHVSLVAWVVEHKKGARTWTGTLGI